MAKQYFSSLCVQEQQKNFGFKFGYKFIIMDDLKFQQKKVVKTMALILKEEKTLLLQSPGRGALACKFNRILEKNYVKCGVLSWLYEVSWNSTICTMADLQSCW